MVFKVGVRYTALAFIEIDVPGLDDDENLPEPGAVVRLFKEDIPELLRASKQQLVSVDTVVVGDSEEIVIDHDCS